MQSNFTRLPFIAAFLDPGDWGRTFTAAMEDYARLAGVWRIGEDMPPEINRITLDPVAKDKFGLPVTHVKHDGHPNDVAMRNHASRQGAAVYEAVGAFKTCEGPRRRDRHSSGVTSCCGGITRVGNPAFPDDGGCGNQA